MKTSSLTLFFILALSLSSPPAYALACLEDLYKFCTEETSPSREKECKERAGWLEKHFREISRRAEEGDLGGVKKIAVPFGPHPEE